MALQVGVRVVVHCQGWYAATPRKLQRTACARMAVLHACYTNTAALLHKLRLRSQVRIQKLVGGEGFEPSASRSRTVRAAKLRQPPTRE